MRRRLQFLLVAGMALYMSQIAADNILDYNANFAFVQHVLSMDTVFPENRMTWRALKHPAWHHVAYVTIIVWEGLTALLLWAGTARLVRVRNADTLSWEQSKTWAEAGLVMGMILWFVGFLLVGGEWFQMWQSQVWNGQNAALRMFAVNGLILLYLGQRDPG